MLLLPFAPAYVLPPGPTFDAVGAGWNNTFGTVASYSHTTGPDAKALLVPVHWATATPPSSVKWGTTTLPQIGNAYAIPGTSTISMALYGLLNPAVSTTATVAVTFAASTTISSNSFSYLNVSTIGTLVTNGDSSNTSLALTIPSAAGHTPFAFFGTGSFSSVQWTPAAPPAAVRWLPAAGASFREVFAADMAGAASAVFNATSGSSPITLGAIGCDLS